MRPDEWSDERLVAAANAGERSALEALYYRYRDWVYRVAWRFTCHHEDALDVVQETFAYLFGKFPGFRLAAQLTTFLYPVAKNLSLTRRRRDRRYVPLGDAEEGPRDPSPAPSSGADFADYLACLSTAERELLLLRFADDLSPQDIADLLGIPLGTVKSRLHKALERLRERHGPRFGLDAS